VADLGSAAVAALIFCLTYFVVAVGRLPGFRLDRAGAALLGASLMVAFGPLSLEEAYRAINLDTIVLLLGMMIVVANLRLSGFFALANAWVARHAHHPLALLLGVTLVSGILSAVLVNDTVCLMLTPLVAQLAKDQRRNPLPYLLAIAMASNIGSAATITGNPQNMMIGSFSQIPYLSFAAALTPISAMGLAVLVAALALAFPGEFLRGGRLEAEIPPPSVRKALLWKSLAATGGMVAAFFLGQPPAKVAIIAGALLLVTRRVKPARIYREIDWSLLVLFAGLFIVVAGLEKAILTPDLVARAGSLHLESVPVLAGVSAVLSNILSNVPAVLVLRPFITVLQDPTTGWLVLAMASTLAGNFTILGSIANLIVVQGARSQRIEIGFWAYFRVGAPVTLITIAFGVFWLL